MAAKSSVIVISEDEDCDLDTVNKDKSNGSKENPVEQMKISPKPSTKRSRFKSTEKSLTSDISRREPVSPVIQSIKTLKTGFTGSDKEHRDLPRNSTAKHDQSTSASCRTSSFPVHFSQSDFSYAGPDFEMIGSDGEDDAAPSQLKRALLGKSSNSQSNGQSRLNLGRSNTAALNQIRAAVGANRAPYQVKHMENKRLSLGQIVRRKDNIQSIQDRIRKKKLLLSNHQVAMERKRAILPNSPAANIVQDNQRKRKFDVPETNTAKISTPEANAAKKTRVNIKPKINENKSIPALEPYEKVGTHVEQLKEHVLPGTHVIEHTKAYTILKENYLSEGLPRIIYDSIKQKLDESYEVQRQLLASEQNNLVQLFDERKKEIEEMKDELRNSTEAQRCSLQKQMDLLGLIQNDHVSKQHEILTNIERLKGVKKQLEREIQKKRMALRLANTRLADKEITKSIRRRSFHSQARDKMKNKIFATLRKQVEAALKRALDKSPRMNDNLEDDEIVSTAPVPSDLEFDADESVKAYFGLQDGYAKHLMDLFRRMRDRLKDQLELEKRYSNIRSIHLHTLSKEQLKYEVKLRDKNILRRIGEKAVEEVLEQYKSVCQTFKSNQEKMIDQSLLACRQRFYRQSLGLSHELQIQCENYYRALWDCQPNLEGGDNFEAICEYEEVTKRSENSRHLLQVTSRLNWIKKQRREAAQSLINSKISFLTFQQQLARDKLRKVSSDAGGKQVPAIVRALRRELTLLKNLEIKESAEKSKKDKPPVVDEGPIDLTGDDSDTEGINENADDQTQKSPGKTSAVLVPILTTTQLPENQSLQQTPRFIMIASNFPSTNTLTTQPQTSSISGVPTILIPQLNSLNFASQPILQVTGLNSQKKTSNEAVPTVGNVVDGTPSKGPTPVPVVSDVSGAQEDVSNVGNNVKASSSKSVDTEVRSIDLDKGSKCTESLPNGSSKDDHIDSKEKRQKCDLSSTDLSSLSSLSGDESTEGRNKAKKRDGFKIKKAGTECVANDDTMKPKKHVQFTLPTVESPTGPNETNIGTGVQMRPVDQFLYDIGYNLVHAQYVDVLPSMRGDPVMMNSIRRLRWKSMEILEYTCDECDFIATCDTALHLHKKTIHPPPSVLFLPGPLPRIPETLVRAKDLCVRFNNRATPAEWEEKIECLWCEAFSYWMPCNSPAEFPQNLLARHHLLTCQDRVTQGKATNHRQLKILLPRKIDRNFVSLPMSVEIDSSNFFLRSPWACELCGHIAVSKSACRRHTFRSHPFHNISNNLICHGCNSKFFTREGFLNHVIKRTKMFRKTRYACPLKITCPFCNHVSVNQKTWPMHMLIIHPKTCKSRLDEFVCPFCYPYGPTGPFRLPSQDVLEDHLRLWHDMKIPNLKLSDEGRSLSTDMCGPLIDAFRSTFESSRPPQLKMCDNVADICPFCNVRVLLVRMVDHMKRCHIRRSFVSLRRCDSDVLKPIVIGLRRCDREEKDAENRNGEISITDVTEESTCINNQTENINMNTEWEEASITSNDVDQHAEPYRNGTQSASLLKNRDDSIPENKVSSSEDESETVLSECSEMECDVQNGEIGHGSEKDTDDESRRIQSTLDIDRDRCSDSGVKVDLICSEQVEVVCDKGDRSPKTNGGSSLSASPNVECMEHSVDIVPDREEMSSEQMDIPSSTDSGQNE